MNTQQFYKYEHYEETRQVGFPVEKALVKRVLHVSGNPAENGLNHIIVESFERKHKDNTMSLGIKAIMDRADRLVQDVVLITDQYGSILGIANFEQIKLKLQQFRSYVELRYQGPGLKKINLFLATVFQHEKSLMRYLKDYARLGLLINRPYYTKGEFESGLSPIRFTNFMKSVLVDIKEEYGMPQTNSEFITIEGEGAWLHAHDGNAIATMLKNNGADVLEKTPADISYNRRLQFDKDTGVLLFSGLEILITCAGIYKKSISYKWQAVAAEDI